MFLMVFEGDKNKLLKKGCKLICEQKIGNEICYVFQNTKRVNFEKENIKYFKINKINFERG
ncbi:MAG: hypothetical protein RSC24_06700 [Clostridium sp.]